MGQFIVLSHITIKLFKNGDYRSSLLPSGEGLGLVTAVAQVQSLGQELSCATGAVKKIKRHLILKNKNALEPTKFFIKVLQYV